MYDEKDRIKEDVNSIIQECGFSPNEFTITVETGITCEPTQIIGTQVWITIVKKLLKKSMGYTLMTGRMSLKPI